MDAEGIAFSFSFVARGGPERSCITAEPHRSLRPHRQRDVRGDRPGSGDPAAQGGRVRGGRERVLLERAAWPRFCVLRSMQTGAGAEPVARLRGVQRRRLPVRHASDRGEDRRAAPALRRQCGTQPVVFMVAPFDANTGVARAPAVTRSGSALTMAKIANLAVVFFVFIRNVTKILFI